MSATGSDSIGDRRLWQERVLLAGFGLLAAALPLAVMTFRSLPLVCGLAAACLLAAWAMAGALRRPRDLVMVAALVLLLLVAGLSIEHTPVPREAIEVLLAHAALPIAVALVLASADPPPAPRKAALVLVCGLALAAVLLIVELRTGLLLHRLFRANLNPSKMNQSAVVMALWLWPTLVLARATVGRNGTAALTLLVGVAVFMSESETAKLALVCGAAAFVLFMTGWRWLIPALAVAVALFMLVQPFIPAIVDEVLPAAALDAMKEGHARERLLIWRAFSAATALQPMTGFGFDSSGEIGAGPLLQRVPEALRDGIRDSHPHNMGLQVWVELGLMGAFLVAVALGRMVRAAGRLDPAVVPAAAAAIVTAVVVAAVGYGAWQAWWLSALGMLPVWLILAEKAVKAARA
ncbi:O-antigen ligase family protein [Alsobacter sp. R-9]